MKTLHPGRMYTPPHGGVCRGGFPPWGLGEKGPDGGSGVKPPKEKFLVNVYCNFIVNLDRSL
jgi:hypothetical protein